MFSSHKYCDGDRMSPSPRSQAEACAWVVTVDFKVLHHLSLLHYRTSKNVRHSGSCRIFSIHRPRHYGVHSIAGFLGLWVCKCWVLYSGTLHANASNSTKPLKKNRVFALGYRGGAKFCGRHEAQFFSLLTIGCCSHHLF